MICTRKIHAKKFLLQHVFFFFFSIKVDDMKTMKSTIVEHIVKIGLKTRENRRVAQNERVGMKGRQTERRRGRE